MKTFKLLSTLALLLLSYPVANAHGPSTAPAKCPGIEGVREMEDLAQDGKTVVIFTERKPISTSYSDGDGFHYFMMNKSEQSKVKPVIKITVLSNKNDIIKTYKFDRWKDYSHIKNKSIADFNFLEFVQEKLNGPFDVYINLSKEKRKKISLKKVPYKLSVEISDHKGRNICRYQYDYGSIYQHDDH